jgi:hypothetical protein
LRAQQRPKFLPVGDTLVWTIVLRNEVVNWVTARKPFCR